MPAAAARRSHCTRTERRDAIAECSGNQENAMNRSPQAVLFVAVLCMALGVAASQAANTVGWISIQVVTPDAKGLLGAARGATIDVRLRGRLMGTFQSGGDGCCSVPLYEAGIAHQMLFSKAGLRTVTLSVTYDAAGNVFTVAPAAGPGVLEKIGPAVYHTVALRPDAAAQPAAGKWTLKLFIVDTSRRDAAGRALPLAGASIAIVRATGQQAASGTSAADGSFQSPPLPTDKYLVKVTLSGYKPNTVDLGTLKKDLVFNLPLTPESGGSVKRTSVGIQVVSHPLPGQPQMALAGAGVYVTQGGRVVANGATDAKGTFNAMLPQGECQVTAMKAGYEPGTATVRVAGGRWANVTVFLYKVGFAPPPPPPPPPPAIVTLTVVVRRSPTLAPVAGARIQWHVDGTEWEPGPRTGADGTARMQVKPGKVYLRVKKDTFATADATVNVPAKDTTQTIFLLPTLPR
jgi:hypothetical protein